MPSPGTASATIGPGPALLMLAFIIAMVIYVFKLQGLDYQLRTRYPQVWGDDGSRRNLLCWRFWADHLLFPHRRVRARLEDEGIRDKALDARITSLVRWNRVTIALYLVVLIYGLSINM